jgi:hypothetical protein
LGDFPPLGQSFTLGSFYEKFAISTNLYAPYFLGT